MTRLWLCCNRGRLKEELMDCFQLQDLDPVSSLVAGSRAETSRRSANFVF